MSYVKLPTRIASTDPNSAADINQLESNIEALKGGVAATAPTTTIEDLSTNKINISAIVNDLTTGGAAVPLSAEQGKTLNTNKVTANVAIVASTKSKITYDAKGLVTAGADLTATDLSLGNVDNTSDATKRIKRVTTITSHATPSINTDDCDCVSITAQAEAITSMTTNLTGTPTNFQKLIIRFKDDGVARAITWGTSFQSGVGTLPTTTVAGKTLLVGLIYDSVDSKWTCEATGSRA